MGSVFGTRPRDGGDHTEEVRERPCCRPETVVNVALDGFTKIGPLDDFRDRQPKNVTAGGLSIVVVKTEGAIHAFENNCPHQHFSMLHQGTIEGCSITCPMHGWTFDLKSGNSKNGSGKLRKLEVRTADNLVWVGNGPGDGRFTLFDEH